MIGQAYISHEKKFVIFWSPKCGSTAVSKWFIHNIFESEKLPQALNRRMLAKFGYTCHTEKAQEFVLNENYKSIFLCRNPYTRSVSTFLNKFYVKHSIPILNYDDLEPFAQSFVDNFNKYRQRACKLFNISFIEYLKFIQICMLEGLYIDRHWETQIPRNINLCVIPDFIIRQESLAEDLGKINQSLGLKSYLPEISNKTSYNSLYQTESRDFSSQSNKFCHNRYIALGYNNLINASTATLISEIYQRDFDYFEYDPRNYQNL